MAQMPERIAYTVKETAVALGVSEWIVREEINRGRIETIRMGVRILIPRWSLENLLGGPFDHGGDNEPGEGS